MVDPLKDDDENELDEHSLALRQSDNASRAMRMTAKLWARSSKDWPEQLVNRTFTSLPGFLISIQPHNEVIIYDLKTTTDLGRSANNQKEKSLYV